MKSRSPLVPGLLILLLALLLGGAWLHRSAPASATRSHENPAAGSSPGSASPAGATPTSPGSKTAPTASENIAPPQVPVRNLLLGGSVIDAKGNPVPLVPVEGFIHDAVRTLTRKTVETDGEGHFRMECPEYTQLTLTAHLQGHGRACYTVQLAGGARSGPGIITLQLRTALGFDGALVLADGSAAADARLRFHPIGTKALDLTGQAVELALINALDPAWVAQCRRELHLTDHEARTDALGHFRADSLIASTMYSVEVIREGQQTVVLDYFTLGSDGRVKLQLPR